MKKQPNETLLFKRYRKEIKRLLALSQIGGGWDITFEEDEELEAYAEVTYNVTNRWACFSFNTERHVLGNGNVLDSARHEFGHFVVARLSTLAGQRYVSHSEMYEANEEIARTFETLLRRGNI